MGTMMSVILNCCRVNYWRGVVFILEERSVLFGLDQLTPFSFFISWLTWGVRLTLYLFWLLCCSLSSDPGGDCYWLPQQGNRGEAAPGCPWPPPLLSPAGQESLWGVQCSDSEALWQPGPPLPVHEEVQGQIIPPFYPSVCWKHAVVVVWHTVILCAVW